MKSCVFGFISIWIALYQGHTDVIKILCEYGVNIHETNWYGQSPKSFAYFQGNEEIFELTEHRLALGVETKDYHLPTVWGHLKFQSTRLRN